MRALVAEFVGAALLLAAVVGSGIMGSGSRTATWAIAVACNTLATGAALVRVILTFGPISGAHFNLPSRWRRHPQARLSWRQAVGSCPRADLER